MSYADFVPKVYAKHSTVSKVEDTEGGNQKT